MDDALFLDRATTLGLAHSIDRFGSYVNRNTNQNRHATCEKSNRG